MSLRNYDDSGELPVLMVQRLRVLGLHVSSLDQAGFELLDENRLSYPRMNRAGHHSGFGWFEPTAIIDKDFAGGYGSNKVMTHYTLLGESMLVLCETLIDALFISQVLKESGLGGACTVAASTVWGQTPAEWSLPKWWAQWDNIHVVGRAEYSAMVGGLVGFPVKARPSVYDGMPTVEGNPSAWVRQWLESATYTPPAPTVVDAQTLAPYTPTDIHCAYVAGHLYYSVTVLQSIPTQIVNDEGEEETIQLERKVLRIIKSDRTMHDVVQSPAPRGTRLEDRVWRLTDGTLISRRPELQVPGTWSHESILDFLKGTASVRPLSELLSDILAVLKSRVWLPYDCDYYVLSLAIVTSYLQAVFEAVPLFLVTGPKDTGKSGLGVAIAAIAANGEILGKITPATISRRIDQGRGLVVLDDLEEIGRKSSSGGPTFTELIQILKLSYKKSTAIRAVTDGSSQVLLNFFGVKVINNTRGVDDILGSRMLKICTARKPANVSLPPCCVDLSTLRDELHTWAAANVAAVAHAYEALPVATNRSEEITACLRVLGQLSGSAVYESNLEAHLNRSSETLNVDVEMHLRALVEEKIRRGDSTISPTETQIALLGKLTGLGHKIPVRLTPEWVGVQLRAAGFVSTDAKPIRTWVDGKFLRTYSLIHPTATSLTPVVDPEIDGGPQI